MTCMSLFGWPIREPSGGGGLPIEVLGVPSDSGNSIAAGSRFAPAAIRRASLSFRPGSLGLDIGDVGDVGGRDWEDVLTAVEAAVAAVIGRGSIPILLGGDHAVSYAGVAAARLFSPLNIVWFDAHTDFCTWPDQGWHNHKQVLRRIAGLDHVGRIVQIGHRGITYFDEAARYDRLSVITADQVSLIDQSRLLDFLPLGEPVYMSVDIDVLDPCVAPGTGHPVPGGLSIERLCELVNYIAGRRSVVAADMMEVNPLLDENDATSVAAATVLSGLVETLTKYV